MRRIFALFIALSLVLSACGTLEITLETPPPEITDIPAAGSALDEAATAEPGLSLSSSSEEIRRAMLESATRWQSIWMDGTFIGYDPAATGPAPVLREQVWIDLPASRFRSLSGYVDGGPERLKVSDGLTVLEMNLQTGQSQSNPLPDLGPQKQFVPTYQVGYASPQPLWGHMGTTISQLAFPSDFAQSEGAFKPVATEFVAGRETLVVEWTYATNDLPSWRAWLDRETAVILRMQEFGKGGGATIQSERVISQVVYNQSFAEELFRAPAEPPQFSDVAGNPLIARETAPAASSDPDPLGDVYFFVSDYAHGNETVQLVRSPGSCAVGLKPCPQAEIIAPPFGLDFSLTALIWSPDGQVAAFAYPVSPDGNRSSLFLFDPQARTWQSLAEFNFIDPPLWSPDGNWLAFRVQDGQGRDEIYAIRRDGSALANLSAAADLPSAGQPYMLNGWINSSVVLRGSGDSMAYLVRPPDGPARPLFESPQVKSELIPSPDGYFLAYADVSGPNTALKLFTPDGNTARELTGFTSASIYPIVWSPDGASLAFAVLAGDPADGQNLYVIGQDGRGLRQVYHSASGSINSLVFAPDGRYLLFQDDDAAGRHIFTLDLSTLQQNMLQVPGLSLDWWWLAPSWKRP